MINKMIPTGSPARSSSGSPPDRHEFGVAIMCALPVEATAVAALFDTTWDATRLNMAARDANAYSVGSIGRHSVVLVHMARMGKVTSATVAVHLDRSFPNLRLALMVGICGGVPVASDGKQALLGDVVFSEGIVQYDLGKQLADRYHPIDPPRPLGLDVSSVVAKFKTLQGRALLRKNIAEHLERIQQTLGDFAVFPGREGDKLFAPDYLHKHRKTGECEDCMDDKVCDKSIRMACGELGCFDKEGGGGGVIEANLRHAVDLETPAVHFGLMASGDTVMRSGKVRDEIAKRTGAIAFEMEGAGMCTVFPNYLVIKSICDYADSHKNKRFQSYAATTASAATKEFLQHWSPYSVSTYRTASPYRTQVLSANDHVLLARLKTTPYRDRKDRNPERIEGTCEWFLGHPTFCEWRDGNSRALWVSADPGCGKSVLARFLVDEVFPNTPTRTTCYFFFKDDFEDQRDAVSAVCSVLHQLFRQQPALFSDDVRGQLSSNSERLTRSFSDLWHILIEAAEHKSAGEILCLWDALDECEDGTRSQFAAGLDTLNRSGKCPNLRFLMTSRPYDSIRHGFQLSDSAGLSVMHLGGENEHEVAKISKEIDIFIRARVESLNARLNLAPADRQRLLQELFRVPHRTYLWVYLTLRHLESEVDIDKEGIINAISTLPVTVDEAYERILSSSTDWGEARRFLQVIVAAGRPVTVQEMNFAANLRDKDATYEEVNLMDEIRFRRRLRSVCGLFVTIVNSKIYLLHQTAREFLVKSAYGKNSEHPRSLSPNKAGNWKHTIDLKKSHYLLANVCIRHLNFREVSLTVNRDDGNTTPMPDVEAITDRHLFLGYSAVNFPLHVRESGTRVKGNKQLTELLVKLCHSIENSCPIWYQVHAQTVEPQRIGLVFASRLGLTAAVRVLVKERGCDIDACDSSGWSALSWAAAYGFTDISRILARGRGWGGLLFFRKRKVVVDVSVLANACRAEWGLEIVRLLVKHGVNLEEEDSDGHTPLTTAILFRQLKTVEVLCDHNAEILKRSHTYYPVPVACEMRDLAMVKFLLDRGAEIEAVGSGGATGLSIAVRRENLALMHFLLDKGANVEAKDDLGQTAIFYAAITKNTAVIQLLLYHGANISAQRKDGQTPLHIACRGRTGYYDSGDEVDTLFSALVSRSFELVKLLLDLGANVNCRDLFGFIPLAYAARCAADVEILELLIDRGADINARDNEDQTVLSFHFESPFFHLETAWFLCKHGADIESRSKFGRTLLSYAAEQSKFSDGLAAALLNKGADVNSEDYAGRSVLSWAASSTWACSDLARLLLNRGAVVNSTDKHGRSPLWWRYNRLEKEALYIRIDTDDRFDGPGFENELLGRGESSHG
ncbi:ankyrin repeat domain-containing protein 50 [Cladorrhinum sp. PSN259]|nr:ankyrin repeat domain-containing protein 50 [Cladorrhinum sp. PSN259]